jgi:hypothetical protein
MAFIGMKPEKKSSSYVGTLRPASIKQTSSDNLIQQTCPIMLFLITTRVQASYLAVRLIFHFINAALK